MMQLLKMSLCPDGVRTTVVKIYKIFFVKDSIFTNTNEPIHKSTARMNSELVGSEEMKEKTYDSDK
jgi:hypothetical protein